jgi:hypothetical protein
MNDKKIIKELEKTHKGIVELREKLRNDMIQYYEYNQKIDDILKNLQEACEKQ